MEVHAPEEPIRTWRDFLIHLVTITVGLLIALGLEAGVEWLHNRHLVQEATETVRGEIAANHVKVAANLKAIHDSEARLRSNLKTLVQLRDGHKQESSQLDYKVNFELFEDSAWRTAQSSGATSHMSYGQAQGVSEVYREQELVAGEMLQLLHDDLHAFAPMYTTGDPNRMSRDEVVVMISRTTDLLAGFTALEQLITGLDREYQKRAK